jgi:hypothetical protein
MNKKIKTIFSFNSFDRRFAYRPWNFYKKLKPDFLQSRGIAPEYLLPLNYQEFKYSLPAFEILLMDSGQIKLEVEDNRLIFSFIMESFTAIDLIKSFIQKTKIKKSRDRVLLKDVRLDRECSLKLTEFLNCKTEKIEKRFSLFQPFLWFYHNPEVHLYRYRLMKKLWTRRTFDKKVSPEEYLFNGFYVDFLNFMKSIENYGSFNLNKENTATLPGAPVSFTELDFAFCTYSKDHLQNVACPLFFCECLALLVLLKNIISQTTGCTVLFSFNQSKNISINNSFEQPEAVFNTKVCQDRNWQKNSENFQPFLRLFQSLIAKNQITLEPINQNKICLKISSKSANPETSELNLKSLLNSYFEKNSFSPDQWLSLALNIGH